MKISLVTNNMGISDKLRFRHHILSLMLGLPVVAVAFIWSIPRYLFSQGT